MRVMICLGQGGLRSLSASSLNYYAHVVNKDTNHGSAYSRRARAASLLQKNHTRTALNYLYCYVRSMDTGFQVIVIDKNQQDENKT